MSVPILSALEARVLGVLVEKQHTVPDTYPMTLSALAGGCNQKTSRSPVMAVTEAEVQATLDALKVDAWVVETSGGRVMRYAHNVERVLDVPAQSAALLAVLMLRGPQTAAELRVNCDRLHRFADVSAVEGFLSELAQRPAGALVVELARAPGTRETRWVQRLSAAPTDTQREATKPSSDIEMLRSDVADLRRDLDRLSDTVSALCAKLAASNPPST
ncbi:MAG: YceH family protein [Casimicrobiaceae bacterium]